VRRIVRASYGGLYVDEYQDCSCIQHDIVVTLARDLPCRILGDPLQGIFDFDGDPIEWQRDVATPFECIGQLDTPHRWDNAGTPALGAWLRNVRRALEDRLPIDLAAARAQIGVRIVDGDATRLLIAQGNACRAFRCEHGDSVIAIHKGEATYKAKCHHLAKKLSGMYSSLEEIEGKDLFLFLGRLQRATTDQRRLKHAIAFAESTMIGLAASLPAGTARGNRWTYETVRAIRTSPKPETRTLRGLTAGLWPPCCLP
jgi:DNA helicase-2/ATP-dependent DNA helicase PcrA